jgi:hypothetical protein
VRRNAPEDPLVRSAEVEGDVLADDQAAVAVDDDAGDEAVDLEQPARLRRRAGRDGRRESRRQGQC